MVRRWYIWLIIAIFVYIVLAIDIPDDLNTIAKYPIAPIADSTHPDLAQAFVDLVLSPDGQAILERYGFIPAAR